MDVKILKDDKHECELTINNLTIAEILRVYLYEAGADFAAWKREHPSKPIIMLIRSKNKTVRKIVSETIDLIKKDCDKMVSAVKK